MGCCCSSNTYRVLPIDVPPPPMKIQVSVRGLAVKRTLSRPSKRMLVPSKSFYFPKEETAPLERRSSYSVPNKLPFCEPAWLKELREKKKRRASLMTDKENALRKLKETGHAEESCDDKGRATVNQYVLLKEIGHGSYGEVWRALDRNSKEEVAIKILRKSVLKRQRVTRFKTALQTVQMEIVIWKRLRHKNVVALLEVIDDPDLDLLYMVSELVRGGPIMPDVLTCEPISEKLAQTYFRQLMVGIQYLHSEQVIHRDIKPGNLLVEENGGLKIADFGVAQLFEGENDSSRATVGTAAFQAPEMHTGEHFSGRTIDLWACGITLYMMLYGRVPFMAPSLPMIYEVIKTKTLVFPSEPAISVTCMDLLQRMLAKKVENRLSMEELMRHDFVRESLDDLDESTSFVGDDDDSSSSSPEEEPAPLLGSSLVPRQLSENSLNSAITPLHNLRSMVLVAKFTTRLRRARISAPSVVLKQTLVDLRSELSRKGLDPDIVPPVPDFFGLIAEEQQAEK